MVKAIGFDLDNTLYDQRQYEYRAFWLVAIEIEKYFGINKNHYFSVLKQLFDKGIRDHTFDKAMKLCKGRIPEKWEDLVKIKLIPAYRSAKPKLKLFPWVKNFLMGLQKKNLKLAIITNGRAEIQEYKINALSIKKYFNKIYISDKYTPPHRKPEIHMFKCFLDDFNLDAKNVVYIGNNSEMDSSCENLGIRFIHYNWEEKFIENFWQNYLKPENI